jgi:hypothetical protein
MRPPADTIADREMTRVVKTGLAHAQDHVAQLM